MLLKKYKVIHGIRFVKYWYSKVKDGAGGVCYHCKFSRFLDLCDLCVKNSAIRNPKLINFTTYIPDQDQEILSNKIKKIEKT